ncbi:MAG: hypothetical protein ACRECF_00730 [Methyloceanibacter sp.]
MTRFRALLTALVLLGLTPALAADRTLTDSDTITWDQSVAASLTANIEDAYKAKIDGIEASADVTDAVNVGSAIAGAATKATPVDADTVPLIDSADADALKGTTWANIKATLEAYFDTLYQPLEATLTSWASVTRAAGFDTFAATPSSANLASLITETTTAVTAATSPGPTLTFVGGLNLVSNTTDANDTVSLPTNVAGDIGKEIEIYAVEGFELISADVSATVNNVVVGATNELAIAAGTYVKLLLVADNTWLTVMSTLIDGTQTKLVPDALN